MALKRINVKVLGRVQGVFFRACTHEQAQKLCLSGWVRNMPDGSVETEFQGDEHEVERMVAWLHKGSPHSMVNEVVVEHRELIDQERGFKVRY